jgi:uncharacterized protein YecE (DUF72 family)
MTTTGHGAKHDGGTVRVGISGWAYKPWRGKFYPQDLPHKRELAYAAERFGSIEVNGTFYRLQQPKSFARWAEDTPDDFVFALKAPRFITHLKRLRDIEAPLANFFASGPLRLGAKLGPVLWQFPANLRFDAERFEAFLARLPHDTQAAAKLAHKHDTRVSGRTWLKTDARRPLRHAVEIRHESFCTEPFIAMLRRHKVALVCADTPEWPLLMDVTSDFVYCRLHGAEELYASGYDDEALDDWARRVRAWARGTEPRDAQRAAPPVRKRQAGRDVYVYFDNDAKVRAPVDAEALAKRLAGLTRAQDS